MPQLINLHLDTNDNETFNRYTRVNKSWYLSTIFSTTTA